MDYLDRLPSEKEDRTEYKQWQDAVVEQDDYPTDGVFGVPIFNPLPTYASTLTESRIQTCGLGYVMV